MPPHIVPAPGSSAIPRHPPPFPPTWRCVWRTIVLMSCLCPGKEAEMVSDDFIAVSNVTETAVCDTRLRQRVVLLAVHSVEMQGVEELGNGGDLVRLAVDLAVPRHPQHSLPGGPLGPTRMGRAPVGSRQRRLAHRVRTPRQDRAAAAVCLSFR